MASRKFDPAYQPLPILFKVASYTQTTSTKSRLVFDAPIQVIPLYNGEDTYNGITALNPDTNARLLPVSITQIDAQTADVVWPSPLALPQGVDIASWGTSIRGLNGGYAAPIFLEVPAGLLAKSGGTPEAAEAEQLKAGESPSLEAGGQKAKPAK